MEKKKIPLLRSSKDGKERGASLVEYGLLVALIAVIGIPAVRAVGDNVNASLLNPDIEKALVGSVDFADEP